MIKVNENSLMDNIALAKGDIFLTKGTSMLSRLVRFFSTTGGESRAQVNHSGIVVDAADGDPVIVEALTHVQQHTMLSQYNDDSTLIAAFRPIGLSDQDIDKVVAKAKSYVGDEYGYFKILAHLGDWCLGGRYFFRRFASMDKYPICSWLVAESFAEIDHNFGCPPGMAEPDDIWEYCRAHPELYEQIWPL